MSVFEEIKTSVTSRDVAKFYGLEINRHGMSCCPFHDDHHPSMKIDKNYYCFSCGAKGDAINYVADMFGLGQYEAARKIISDLSLPINVESQKYWTNDKEHRKRLEEIKRKKQRAEHIKRFENWCMESIDRIKNALENLEIVKSISLPSNTGGVIGDTYTRTVRLEEIMNYWLDVLCTGSTEERMDLFIENRREVDKNVEQASRLYDESTRRSRKNHR